MESLLGRLNFATFGGYRFRNDDDFSDRLSHRYTTFLLLVFCVVVTTRQYVGDPINCWCPGHFTSNYIDYTNKICWVSNTYYLPLQVREIPMVTEPRQMINYYQWIPMILLVEALFFALPSALWRSFNNRVGVDVTGAIDVAVTLNQADMSKDRTKALEFLTRHLDTYLRTTTDTRLCIGRLGNLGLYLCRPCKRRYGAFLLGLYLITKLFYLLNAVAQLFVMNMFLSTDFHVYGMEVISKLFNAQDEFAFSERFPRVTLCDFSVRQLGNIHRHTVQCVLPINLFNEKIFIFLWFWLVLICIISGFSLIVWIWRTFNVFGQITFIKGHLRAMTHDSDEKIEAEKSTRAFVTEYLRQDGVLILRLIQLNAYHIVTTEIVAELWRNWNRNKTPHSPDYMKDGIPRGAVDV